MQYELRWSNTYLLEYVGDRLFIDIFEHNGY
jgi:hypothetical protein